MRRNLCFALVAVLALAAAPVFADPVIYGGIDLWRTVESATFADFSSEPLPAGFFCANSQPFTGRITFQGVPVATDTPKALGRTDTIVERLDDGTFNARGMAVTRVQVKALNFRGSAPVRTSCGDFNVRVALNGQQPITTMRIFREDETGGRFLAPISVNVKLTFVPVSGKAARPLVVTQQLRFASDPRARWSDRAADLNKRAPSRAAYIKVDTDGDGSPDTFIRGTSNFIAGVSFGGENKEIASSGTVYHSTPAHGHGTTGELSPLLISPEAT